MDKKETRKKYIRLRNEMPHQEVKSLSEDICRNIAESDVFKEAEYIYAYYPLGNEVDVRLLVEKAWGMGKRVSFPRTKGEDMDFFEADSFDDFEEGNFHVMEPKGDNPVNWEKALVIVPGVAFDKRGNRMGYGKGYYDHFLENHKDVITMAASYELQIMYEVPTESHDVPLDYVATEKRIYG